MGARVKRRFRIPSLRGRWAHAHLRFVFRNRTSDKRAAHPEITQRLTALSRACRGHRRPRRRDTFADRKSDSTGSSESLHHWVSLRSSQCHAAEMQPFKPRELRRDSGARWVNPTSRQARHSILNIDAITAERVFRFDDAYPFRRIVVRPSVTLLPANLLRVLDRRGANLKRLTTTCTVCSFQSPVFCPPPRLPHRSDDVSSLIGFLDRAGCV
jgi:hypothetical protein